MQALTLGKITAAAQRSQMGWRLTMTRSGTLALVAALAAFGVYFVNVVLGAASRPLFLGDVAEMVTLLIASSLFVIGILQRETARNQNNADA